MVTGRTQLLTAMAFLIEELTYVSSNENWKLNLEIIKFTTSKFDDLLIPDQI